MKKKRKFRKARRKTTSFKSFEKLPFSETVKIKGKIYNTQQYFNRDMSWLSFNERVLFEAIEDRTPLLERLRFIDIFRSNADEFFMKRVSLLVSKIVSGDASLSIDGRNSLDLYNQFLSHVSSNWQIANDVFKTTICPALEKQGIKFYQWSELNVSEKQYLKDHFKDNIFPILIPLAVDGGHPFPFISNLSKSIGVCLKAPKKKGKYFARIKIPTVIPQWIVLPPTADFGHRYINIEDVICNNLQALFPGMKIDSYLIFRITRDASMGDEEESVDTYDLLESVSEGLIERKFSNVVRLEVDNTENRWLIDYLLSELELQEEQLSFMPSLICYSNFSNIVDLNIKKLRFVPFSGHKYPKFDTQQSSENIFQIIASEDHLLHFPYDCYSASVERFLRASCFDPQVRAIKIVLYRTDTDGRLIDILIEAAERGKQVAVVIELKARFDEERNIQWAQRLEDYGIHVTYGLGTDKTHAKLILVVRDENKKLKTYVNIGTGNFNSQTSKLYTDLSLFTADKKIGEEVVELFNFLTGRCLEGNYKKLLVAPFNMFSSFLKLIQAEMTNAKEGKPAEIIVKINSLEDPDIIEALYKASAEGVMITLIVRGLCCLKPGVKGLSENIKVISLVGRLLEHSRIFYFRNGAPSPEEAKFYIGSADWMNRNLHNRVEVITPITSISLRKKIFSILETIMKDNQNVWELTNNGTYKQRINEKNKFSAQDWFIENKKDTPL